MCFAIRSAGEIPEGRDRGVSSKVAKVRWGFRAKTLRRIVPLVRRLSRNAKVDGMRKVVVCWALFFAAPFCLGACQAAAVEREPDRLDFSALPGDERICDWLRKASPTFDEAYVSVLRLPDAKEIKFKSVDWRETDFSEVGVFFGGGVCEIRLSNRLQGAGRVRTLAFEVANASLHEEHRQIDKGAVEGFFTAREYAIAHEIYEYEAWRLYRRCLFELERKLGTGRVPRELFYGAPATKVADYRLPPLAAHLKYMETSRHMQHYLNWFEKHYAKRTDARR
jgi:hypothetical protein